MIGGNAALKLGLAGLALAALGAIAARFLSPASSSGGVPRPWALSLWALALLSLLVTVGSQVRIISSLTWGSADEDLDDADDP